MSSDEDEFLDRLDRIVVHKSGDYRAPHKPFLLLLALGRVLSGRERLVEFAELKRPLKSLLLEFGPPRKSVNPELPFIHLRSDGIWEIPGDKNLPIGRAGRLLASGLHKHSAKGGFPEPVFRLLQRNPLLVRNAAQRIVEKHFPTSLHHRILDACDFPATPEHYMTRVSKRHREFRIEVLGAYRNRCAVCGYDLRLNDVVFGIDAAHIKWHSHSGPDIVQNGLALCTLHHEALDRGALGLHPSENDQGLKLLVSSNVSGVEAVQGFRSLHGTLLRLPESEEFLPRKAFVEWHRTEVFRGPMISIDAD